MHILLTGGTGFVGTHLTRFLIQNGFTCSVLTRNPQKYKATETDSLKFYPVQDEDYIGVLMEKSDVVINLAGENLFDQRWTESVKKSIVASRVETTRMLTGMIKKAKKKPKVMVSASAIGIYGDRGEEKLTEQSHLGDDFLAEVCKKWEKEALEAEPYTRVVIPRIGIVLETDDGALKKMLTPFKLFVGGPLGDGRQYFSWVHMQDICQAILFAINEPGFSGPFNLTAPEPVTMKNFAKVLGEALKRPSLFPVPEFVLKLALGEAYKAVLASQNVVPEMLQNAGFTFSFPEVKKALLDLVK